MLDKKRIKEAESNVKQYLEENLIKKEKNDIPSHTKVWSFL